MFFLQPPISAFKEDFKDDCWFSTAFAEGTLAKKDSTQCVSRAIRRGDYAVFCRRSTQGCKARVFAITGTVAPLPIALHCCVLYIVHCGLLLSISGALLPGTDKELLFTVTGEI